MAFTDELYLAGATRVDVEVDVALGLAKALVVHLPVDPAARVSLFDLFRKEEDAFGEDFGVDPNGRAGREMTEQEARDAGDPTLEGYWLEEDGPCNDVGQKVVSLWWD